MTIMLAWNAEDAGKIIETYKIYENKPPDDIMERCNTAPHQKVIYISQISFSLSFTHAYTHTQERYTYVFYFNSPKQMSKNVKVMEKLYFQYQLCLVRNLKNQKMYLKFTQILDINSNLDYIWRFFIYLVYMEKLSYLYNLKKDK